MAALWNEKRPSWISKLSLCLGIAAFLSLSFSVVLPPLHRGIRTVTVPIDLDEAISRCDDLAKLPGPLPSFFKRTRSDRYVPGTKDVWIRNAMIWTGRKGGQEVLHQDILLSSGLIKRVGSIASADLRADGNVIEVDARGAWVSPGIVDVHSHLGVDPSPSLSGAQDGNSLKGTVQPWLRALDALNTHDESLRLGIAGGVTTSLLLPGSANAIGGQGYVVKLRPTTERSPTAMLLEPPSDINATATDYVGWKHMKHACGENPARVYGDVRMDSVWAWREGYNNARKLMRAQDAYCSNAKHGQWHELPATFPQDLRWQPLVDILRGKVKVQTHCYEAVDFDNFVRLSNEFAFPVAAFHHAHEAYLVPNVLKEAHGPTPAVAIFASFSGYKREAYHSTSFAAHLLDKAGIRVVMKSDHPAITSRFLLHEAQQAHHFGLSSHQALSSVTTTPASVIGLDHRIGMISEGYDADVVIWDSHPLALGATPLQVFIDGISQLEVTKDPVPLKTARSQTPPTAPNHDREASDALQREGITTLDTISAFDGQVAFTNVSNVWMRNSTGVVKLHSHAHCVVVEGGRIIGTETLAACSSRYADKTVDLKGGSIAPAIVAAGTSIGLQEIAMEQSTTDGTLYSPWDSAPDSLVGFTPRAVDGLVYATRDSILSYRAGVTAAITAPAGMDEGEYGLSASIATGTRHKLDAGAIIQPVSALHITLARGATPSISTRIAVLRHLMLDQAKSEEGWFGKVALGKIPLAVRVDSADIIATLIQLKREVEVHTGAQIRITLLGAAEAHILADELAAAQIGVLVQPRSFPYKWDSRRILPGPPLSPNGLAVYLWSKNATVGLIPQGIDDTTPLMAGWSARNLRWDAGWIESQSELSREDALALVSSNIDALLGSNTNPEDTDLVATSAGDLLSFEGKVAAIISPRRGLVDVL